VNWSYLFRVAAVVCFILAVLGLRPQQLTAAGLALFAASFL
jgi:hypothetical protein